MDGCMEKLMDGLMDVLQSERMFVMDRRVKVQLLVCRILNSCSSGWKGSGMPCIYQRDSD